MGVRRLLALVHGLGYGFQPVQRAPASAGASAVYGTVTSLRDFARALKDPGRYIDG